GSSGRVMVAARLLVQLLSAVLVAVRVAGTGLAGSGLVSGGFMVGANFLETGRSGGAVYGICLTAQPIAGLVRVDGLPWGTQRGKQDSTGVSAGPQPEEGTRCCARVTAGDDRYTKSLQRGFGSAGRPPPANDSYLVDSASSHMLVSKIKPCMSKYKQLYSETANGSLYKLSFI
ncbi:hypothetical protein E4U17_000405, partial [Claviceps sp. LM77 group G4]